MEIEDINNNNNKIMNKIRKVLNLTVAKVTFQIENLRLKNLQLKNNFKKIEVTEVLLVSIVTMIKYSRISNMMKMRIFMKSVMVIESRFQ